MSWQTEAVVRGKTIGNLHRKFVLLELANHAQADGTASWPSKATMAKVAECDVKTVQRHLRKLEADGWIRRGDQELVSHIRADRRPVVYDVAMDDATRARWAADHAAEKATPRTGSDTAHTAAQDTESGGTECTPVTRDDGTDCPPAPDATGGQASASRGDAAVSPKYPEDPNSPQPPTPPGPSNTGAGPSASPLPDHCPTHPAHRRGCKPCRAAKQAAGDAAVAALERAAKIAADEQRRAQAAAWQAQEAADRARLAQERGPDHVATKAAVRAAHAVGAAASPIASSNDPRPARRRTTPSSRTSTRSSR